MKKKIIIVVIIIIAFVLFFPIPFHLNDGGSIEFRALLYTITKYHKLDTASENGYNDGIGIEILGMEIYNNLKHNNIVSVPEANDTYKRIVMVNGKLYYDTGTESTIKARCGNMDGQITSNVNPEQTPSIDDQSNFEGTYGYQRVGKNTVELYINDKWIVFETKDKIYIRTYTIENIKQSDEENSYYITLSKFQDETDTVLISSLSQKLEVGKTYEFEFLKEYNSNNVNDSIKSIFENCTIISITETNKKGLEQTQDSIN